MMEGNPPTAKPRRSANRHLGSWNETAQAQALRVELNDGSLFVFPYIHWMFAKLERENDQDLLTVSFGSHDLHITGRHLRDLTIAFQKFAVDWIKETPERYASLSSEETALIGRIEIVEHQNDDQRPAKNS